MKTAIPRFLRYLQVERNASELTIKSYREDFEALVEYLTEAFGHEPTPGEITPIDLRGYVGALHEAGYAKASVSRRLASLRSFFRFAQREELVDSNPAKPLRNPRRDRTLPHFLSTDEIGQLLDAPPHTLHEQAFLASQRGWLEYRHAGTVTEIGFSYLLRKEPGHDE